MQSPLFREQLQLSNQSRTLILLNHAAKRDWEWAEGDLDVEKRLRWYLVITHSQSQATGSDVSNRAAISLLGVAKQTAQFA